MYKIEIAVDVRHELGESVVWDDRSGDLVWVDIHRGRLWRYASSGRLVGHSMPNRIGAVGLRQGAGYVVGLAKSFGVFDPVTDRYETVAEVEPELPHTRLNDGRCDRDGNFLCGGINEGGVGKPDSGLYRLCRDGRVETVMTGIRCANSTCFSPDGRTLYFSDMPTGDIVRFDYDGAGPLAAARPFHSLSGRPGLPDGSTVDAEGCLWNTHWGGGRIVRYSPAGETLLEVDLPVSNPTCLAFGDADYRTLYITTAFFQLTPEQRRCEPLAGAVLKMRTDVEGLPEPHFRG
ncbi:SMP-30/gluconolactonase/LRE family protein [Ensifer soli]|uniref:SMP-30/gluconolactonase/LRE family protein n=1 Tax=Ciceribacter sp. sgz301302 TaxID=3342379 RepID=UPI0035B8D6D7